MRDNTNREAVLQVDGFLYDFYRKVALSAGKSTEQVMADALAKFAADAAAKVQKPRLFSRERE